MSSLDDETASLNAQNDLKSNLDSSPNILSELESKEGIDIGEKKSVTNLLDDLDIKDQENEINENEVDKVIVDEEKKDEWQDLLGSGSIKKKVIWEGEPHTRPQRLQKCLINYSCYLQDGTLVESEDGFEMNLGDCEVIQGLDVAIGLMNAGEKCKLIIEPRLAYGSIGLPPKIPKDAVVSYDVELLSVEDDEEMENLTISQRKLRGNKKRERGNWWYGRGENTLAVQCYRRALDYLDEVEGGIKYTEGVTEEITDSALQDLLEDRISVHNNMAAAQIKLELYEPALKSLQTVLRCQPNNVKALFRKAKIHKAQNDFPSALKCLQKANQISPNNMDIQKETAAVSAVIQKQKVTEKELARRMFNGPKAAVKEDKGKQGRSSLFIVASIGVAVAVGMIGMATYKMKFPIL